MSKKLPPLRFEPSIGAHVRRACQTALLLAKTKNRVVQFDFNGTRMKVHKRLSIRHLMRQWDERIHASVRRYEMSVAGKAQIAARKEEISRKQLSVDTLFARLPEIIDAPDELMSWLLVFTQDADDVSVKFSHHQHLAAQLETAGYVEDEHVGQQSEWFNTRERLGHYIVGQMMVFLRKNRMPPQIITKFIDHYFEIPQTEQPVPET